MLAFFRILLSILLFAFSCYCVYDIIANEFHFGFLCLGIVGFLSIRYVWPDLKSVNSRTLEGAEFLLELPFHILTGIPRALFFLLKNFDG